MTDGITTPSSRLRQLSAAAGLVLVAIHILMALAAPFIIPYDAAAQNSAAILEAPSVIHLFGTDRLGRDVFSRTLLGGREAMLIATFSTIFAMAWGSLLGIVVALAGGRLDAAVMRMVDAMIAIPWILLVMLFVAALGSSTAALVPLLGFSYGLSVIYLARSAALDFVTRDFVLAAQVRGESHYTIAVKEIFPNIRDSIAVQGAMQWSWIFLSVSSLSFLGMGVEPPTPDWGQMISDARGIMRIAPWTVVWPVIFLSSLIIGVNLAVDAWSKAIGISQPGRIPQP